MHATPPSFPPFVYRILIGAALATTLSACGYKGPLYMPPPPEPDTALTTPPPPAQPLTAPSPDDAPAATTAPVN